MYYLEVYQNKVKVMKIIKSNTKQKIDSFESLFMKNIKSQSKIAPTRVILFFRSKVSILTLSKGDSMNVGWRWCKIT